MKRVVVTGASGLVGRSLIRRLAGRWHVVALSRNQMTNDQSGIDWVVADLNGSDFVNQLPARYDAVVHLAQSAHYRDFPDAAEEVWNVATTSTHCLLRHAVKAGASHYILASTGGLYAPSPQPIGEDAPADNDGGTLSFYFAAKRAAEMLAREYEELLTCITLRFFFVYGAGQRDNMLMPRLALSVARGDPILLAGANGLRFNPIYCDDAAAAVEAALDCRQSATINVAGPEAVSLRQVADMLGNALSCKPKFKALPETSGNDVVSDIARMRSMLVSPSLHPGDGLMRMVAARSWT